MEQLNLKAEPRNDKGKGPSGRLRVSGKVPAILYGPEIKGAIPLSLNNKELEAVLHTAAGGNIIVNLNLPGDKKARTVMFKVISRHPLKGTIEHVDFIEVLMDRRVIVEAPIHIVGRAEGLAFGGIVQQETRRIKIECLPAEIPDSLAIDVTPLGIGQSFHVRDIKLPEGIRVIDDPNLTVVSVVAPMAEVAPKTAEEVKAELEKSFEVKEEPKEGEGAVEGKGKEKEKEKEKEKKK
ncbi:MAG: 50S ribosomal protein L25 [Deltaproteobacteria bacterium]|nr:50S ribosomal protein L25 [Deltaproteobacteria bacterium]